MLFRSTSSSTVENFHARFDLPALVRKFPGLRLATIGPETTKALTACVGKRPVGWTSPGHRFTEDSVELLAQEGYLWSGDQANDDVPYVVKSGNKKIVIAPKTLYAEDKTAWDGGIGNGASFFTGYKNTFDYVYQEALRGRPGRVNATIHAELGARPHLLAGFEKMMQYANRYRSEVWVATNREMAEWTLKTAKDAETYDVFA